jgi:putative restriction endonuclease
MPQDLASDPLGYLSDEVEVEDLFGQDDLPRSTGMLLAGSERELQELEQAFAFDERLTEQLAERKIRLAQHRFALEVLENCGRACVFCGFEPHSLPMQSGLLHASHIKPWAVSDQRDRVDVRNGLAACPIHDAAFDRGYITVNGGYHIHRADALRESIARDNKAALYFKEALSATLLLPLAAKKPALSYLLVVC